MRVISPCAHTDGLEVTQIEVSYIEITSVKNGEELKEYVRDQINIVKKMTMEDYIKEIKPQLDKFIAEHGMTSAHIFLAEEQEMSKESIEILVKYIHGKALQEIKENVL